MYANRDVSVYDHSRKTVSKLVSKWGHDLKSRGITGEQVEALFLKMFGSQMIRKGRRGGVETGDGGVSQKGDGEEESEDVSLPQSSLASLSLSSLDSAPEVVRGTLAQVASRIANAPITDRMAHFYALRIGDELRGMVDS